MKVHLIEELKEKYKLHLQEVEDFSELYKYECIQNFQDNWSLDALQFSGMYDKSLSSKMSSRLWGGRRSAAFADLFDEDKDASMRVNRFKFYCDEMLRDLQNKNKKASYHKHDLRMISTYLAFKYPDKYCIFDYKLFSKLMEKLEVLELPQDFEIDRFFKLSKALFTILSKDTELIALHNKLKEGNQFYQEPCMMLVHDLMVWSKESDKEENH